MSSQRACTGVGVWVLLVLVGCRTASRTPPPPVLPPPAAVTMAERAEVGSVVRVGRSGDYAILCCAILPYDKEELKIYRAGKEIGAVRVTGPKKPPFFVADILRGTLARGDRAKRDSAPERNRSIP